MSTRPRLRALPAASRRAAEDLWRILRVLIAARRKRIVGYTKPHPIYTDVFERHPPEGYVFYRRATTPWLRPLDRAVWRRLALVHYDAASPRDPELRVPAVIECEGSPTEALLRDARVRHVFVESRWAGGSHLDRGLVTLLRPSVPVPPRRPRAANHRPVTLLAVGHGGMVKGLDVVARLYEHLRRTHQVRLVIAGSFGHNFEHYPEVTREAYAAADFPALERRLRADPHVRVRPVRRSALLRRVYPAADIYLHLSRLETFGLSILEAMSHGLPVVATRLHAIPEMVRDGQTGFLVDIDGLDINSAAWSDRVFHGALSAVEQLLGDCDLRAALGAAGRERVRRSFDIEYKRRELARVYGAILDGHDARAARGPVEAG